MFRTRRPGPEGSKNLLKVEGQEALLWDFGEPRVVARSYGLPGTALLQDDSWGDWLCPTSC